MKGPCEKRLKGEIPMPKFACQCITWGPANNSENKELIFREVKQAGFTGLEMGARNLRTNHYFFRQKYIPVCTPPPGDVQTACCALSRQTAQIEILRIIRDDGAVTANHW